MESVVHRCISNREIKELILYYTPYLLDDKYFLVKRNYCSDDHRILSYMVSRYPIDKEIVRYYNSYELLFFPLQEGEKEYIYSLYNYSYQPPSNRQVNILFKLTNQQLIVWVKNGISEEEKQKAYDYIGQVNKTQYVSNHAVEVLQRFANYKYGITNLFLPGQISILTTDKCNAECVHCYRRNQLSKENKLTPERFQKLLEDISNAEISSVNLLGGEPTLREDLLDIICKAQELKLQLKITTNGIKLSDDEYAKKIAPIFDNTLSMFQISIDGVGERQDALRHGAEWGLMEKAFHNLKKYNIRFQVNSVVTRSLYADIDNYFKEMDRLHIKDLRFTMLKQCGKGNEFASLVLTPKETNEAMEKINNLGKRYGMKVTNGLRAPIFMVQEEPKKYLSKVFQSCNALNYQMTVGYNLEYLPCEFYEPFDSAWGESYLEMDIETFWHTSRLIPQFRRFEIDGKCKECKYNLYCSKGCPVETTYLVGANNHSNPLCWYNPEKERTAQMFYPDYAYLEGEQKDEKIY